MTKSPASQWKPRLRLQRRGRPRPLPSARLFDSDEQGYLVRVAQRYPSRNQVHVHVLNTRSKARRTGWELLWGDNGDWSKEKRTPVTELPSASNWAHFS